MANYNPEQTKRMQDVHGMPLASFGCRAAACLPDIE